MASTIISLQHKQKYTLKLDIFINNAPERNERLDFVYLDNYNISATYEFEFDNEGAIEVKIEIFDETGTLAAYGGGISKISRGTVTILPVDIYVSSKTAAPRLIGNDWTALRKKYGTILDTDYSDTEAAYYMLFLAGEKLKSKNISELLAVIDEFEKSNLIDNKPEKPENDFFKLELVQDSGLISANNFSISTLKKYSTGILLNLKNSADEDSVCVCLKKIL